ASCASFVAAVAEFGDHSEAPLAVADRMRCVVLTRFTHSVQEGVDSPADLWIFEGELRHWRRLTALDGVAALPRSVRGAGEQRDCGRGDEPARDGHASLRS